MSSCTWNSCPDCTGWPRASCGNLPTPRTRFSRLFYRPGCIWTVSGPAANGPTWPGSERAYLARIVINECRNVQRARQRIVPVPDFPNRTSVPEAGLRELRDAVDRLPEKLRIPFLLVYMEGCSAKEAASILEISLFALKSRLKRAKKLLQSEFEEREEGHGTLYTERSAENV